MAATATITNLARWQTVLAQQKIANAQRWLTLLENSQEPAKLVQEDYDNFLRALETTLQNTTTFEIAYKLYLLLYPIVFGYADWDRWLVYLRQALHTSRLLAMQDREALLLEKIGDILYHKGDLDKAEKAILRPVIFIKV